MKGKYKIFIILIISIVLFFIGTRSFTNYIEGKITNAINQSNSNLYITNVEKVDFKLFGRSLIFKDIFYGPYSNISPDSIQQIIINDSVQKVTIASVKINNIHYLDYILDRFIRIGQIEVNDVFIERTNEKNKDTTQVKPIKLDSIYIDKLNGFEIERFDFNNIQYTVVDSISHEIIFDHKPTSFNLDGFQLKKVHGQLFKVELNDKIFEIYDIELDVAQENYKLSIGEISLNTKTSDIQIKDLKFEPEEDRVVLAEKFKYNDAIKNFNIDLIHLYQINLTKLLKNQGIFIDSILVSKGVFDFYKDKRKPFNEKLVKKLPHELLKEMIIPISIDHISFDDCQIKAENRFPHKDLLMKLSMNSVYGQIKNISNLKDQAKIPLKIHMDAKLMNKGHLIVDVKFPMDDPHYNFYFGGSLGKSKFRYYDDIIYPALGLKVLKGELDHLSFSGKGNNYSANGTMRMLYHDLDATVYKKDSNEKSQFLSWAIKTVLHNSNPVKRKDVRVATMYHKHEKHIGFVGYLWKTLQSGIVNTLAPTGNKTSKKANKIIEKRKRKEAKKK